MCIRDRWDGDGLELNIEMDAQRRLGVRENSKAYKIFLYPQPGAGPGQAGVKLQYGPFSKDAVKAAWQKTGAGYTVEFLIPAEALAPARMVPGTRMGLYFVVRDNGKTREQSKSTDGVVSVWSAPVFWGAALLVEN